MGNVLRCVGQDVRVSEVSELPPSLRHGRHIQFSSLPERHEPQHGEVNMPFLLDVVDSLGYDGWTGECAPKAGTLEGLSWAAGGA